MQMVMRDCLDYVKVMEKKGSCSRSWIFGVMDVVASFKTGTR